LSAPLSAELLVAGSFIVGGGGCAVSQVRQRQRRGVGLLRRQQPPIQQQRSKPVLMPDSGQQQSPPPPPGWALSLFRKTRSPARLLSCRPHRHRQQNRCCPCRRAKRESAASFKAVRGYMGDRRSSQSKPQLAKQLVVRGLQMPGMRDEQLMQLCKQLTANPSLASLQLGWELLALGEFAPYLEGFLLRRTLRLSNRSSSSRERRRLKVASLQRQFAAACLRRLRRVLTVGARRGREMPPRRTAGSQADKAEQRRHRVPFRPQRTIFRTGVFGGSLEELVSLQRQRLAEGGGSSLFRDAIDWSLSEPDLPWVPAFLADEIQRLGGLSTEGIFRARRGHGRGEQGAHPAGALADACVAASLLKLWYRELPEPLIPQSVYSRALEAANSPDEAAALLKLLPPLNSCKANTISNVAPRTQAGGGPSAAVPPPVPRRPAVARATKMDAAGLAVVMAPSLLRCPSADPRVAFDCARREADFVRALLLHGAGANGTPVQDEPAEVSAAPVSAPECGDRIEGILAIKNDLPEIDEEEDSDPTTPAAELPSWFNGRRCFATDNFLAVFTISAGAAMRVQFNMQSIEAAEPQTVYLAPLRPADASSSPPLPPAPPPPAANATVLANPGSKDSEVEVEHNDEEAEAGEIADSEAAERRPEGISAQQQQQQQQQQQGVTYLGMSALTALFFNLPLGGLAVYFSIRSARICVELQTTGGCGDDQRSDLEAERLFAKARRYGKVAFALNLTGLLSTMLTVASVLMCCVP
uniref:Rho-GAP domain-containing protein n=1 Tax=Macrostomum lignano TaxID=282301 RepID=A0A1I8JR00_9PLAT